MTATMITADGNNIEATMMMKKERRRSSFEQSNRNKNGVLEWTAWNRPTSKEGGKLLDAGPKPKRASVNLPQEWVSNVKSSIQQEEAATATTTNKKERRRSSFEQSNRNKNGVLEWTAWKRPSSSESSLTAETSSTEKRRSTGPRPKRASVNIPQEWSTANAKAIQESEEEKKEDDNGPFRRDSNPDDWEPIVPEKPKESLSSSSSMSKPAEVETSWLAQNIYGILLAGVVVLVAYGMKMVLDSKVE